MAVRCSARSYIYSRRAERAFGGRDRHELVRVVLGSIPVRAVEAQVTWIVVVIVQPFGTLKKFKMTNNMRRRTTSVSQQARSSTSKH